MRYFYPKDVQTAFPVNVGGIDCLHAGVPIAYWECATHMVRVWQSHDMRVPLTWCRVGFLFMQGDIVSMKG